MLGETQTMHWRRPGVYHCSGWSCGKFLPTKFICPGSWSWNAGEYFYRDKKVQDLIYFINLVFQVYIFDIFNEKSHIMRLATMLNPAYQSVVSWFQLFCRVGLSNLFLAHKYFLFFVYFTYSRLNPFTKRMPLTWNYLWFFRLKNMKEHLSRMMIWASTTWKLKITKKILDLYNEFIFGWISCM